MQDLIEAEASAVEPPTGAERRSRGLRRPGGGGRLRRSRRRLEELLEGCARGDLDSIARLYDLTAPQVFGLVTAVVGEPRRSERVTAEVYVDIWRSAPRRPADRPAMDWVVATARRHAVAEAGRSTPG